jgi:hypothetical protein
MNTATNRWADRVDRAGWGEITCQVNEHGCALTPQLMTPAECERIARLYDSDELFRSTIDMSRYRFGSRRFICMGIVASSRRLAPKFPARSRTSSDSQRVVSGAVMSACALEVLSYLLP